jgi:hypothetical protein
MIADALMSGHVTLADWLFLLAAVVFVIAAVLAWTKRPDPTTGALVPIGLALVAVGWLVL